MKRTIALLSWFVVLGMIIVPRGYCDSLTLTLNPSNGEVSGVPGTTIGWGFTLNNSGDNFAVITSADFCGSVITSPCSTPLGNFTDFIAQYNFTVIDPHTSLSGLFDPLNFGGIGSYQLYADALIGTSFAGQLTLTYDLYAGGPGVYLIRTDIRTSAAASALVTAPVPEPATLILLGTGCLTLALIAFKRRRS